MLSLAPAAGEGTHAICHGDVYAGRAQGEDRTGGRPASPPQELLTPDRDGLGETARAEVVDPGITDPR